MTDVSVWIDDWVHQCCGEARRVGGRVCIALTFVGDVVPTTEPDQVDVLSDGRVSIVGTVTGPPWDAGVQEGSPIMSGPVRFGIRGHAPASRVRCVGKLEEIRHGYPSAVTSGELVGICWRPANLREVGPGSFVVEGYGPGQEVCSTDDLPDMDLPQSWALELTLRIGG